jgi:hypothetical protein
MSQTQHIYVNENVVTIMHNFISPLLLCCMLHGSNHHIRPLSKKLKSCLPTYITEHKKLLMCICVYCVAECLYWVTLWACVYTAQGQALDFSIIQVQFLVSVYMMVAIYNGQHHVNYYSYPHSKHTSKMGSIT